MIWPIAECKESHFKGCHLGKLKLEYTSPNVILTSTKNILIAKSTSPGLSDTTFFARWIVILVSDSGVIRERGMIIIIWKSNKFKNVVLINY